MGPYLGLIPLVLSREYPRQPRHQVQAIHVVLTEQRCCSLNCRSEETLGLWQALTVAVQSGWGGSETLEKRDWFAGAVSTLLADRPDTDQEDLEVFLLQIMEDEFDCRVEDETEIEVARNIMQLRSSLGRVWGSI